MEIQERKRKTGEILRKKTVRKKKKRERERER